MMNLRILRRCSGFVTRDSTRNISVRDGDSLAAPDWRPPLFRFCLAHRTLSTSAPAQAGHSHWQNIKQIKGANDMKRAAIANRVARDMRVAVKLYGSANPKDNSELAKIIQYAKSENLPSETIERTLASCAAGKGKVLESITLECKGPAGSLMILELSSGNVNRTKQEMRSIFKKHVASIVDGGGVLHSFEQKGILTVRHPQGVVDLGKEEETAIEVGAEEVLEGDFPGEVVYICDPMEALKVSKALEKMNYTLLDNVTEYIPKAIIEIPQEALQELNNLKAKLEEHPDFSNMYFNCAT